MKYLTARNIIIVFLVISNIVSLTYLFTCKQNFTYANEVLYSNFYLSFINTNTIVKGLIDDNNTILLKDNFFQEEIQKIKDIYSVNEMRFEGDEFFHNQSKLFLYFMYIKLSYSDIEKGFLQSFLTEREAFLEKLSTEAYEKSYYKLVTEYVDLIKKIEQKHNNYLSDFIDEHK